MQLVDTSVWVDHLRQGDPELAAALERGQVMTHPAVIGELALGNLKQREQLLSLMADLPQSKPASDAEVLHLINSRQLMGHGIGYVDVHLLASCLLSTATLWTRDQRLRQVAIELAIGSG